MCQAGWGWLHGVPYWMPARCVLPARLGGVGYMVFPTGCLLDVHSQSIRLGGVGYMVFPTGCLLDVYSQPGWVRLVTWCSLLDAC